MYQIIQCKIVCKCKIQEINKMSRLRRMVELSMEYAEGNTYYEITRKNEDLCELIWSDIYERLLSDTQNTLINQNAKDYSMLPFM